MGRDLPGTHLTITQQMPKEKQITIPEYAKLTALDVIEIYAMIDSGKIKSIHKDKKTMIILL